MNDPFSDFPHVGPPPTALMAQTLDAIGSALSELERDARTGDPELTRAVARLLNIPNSEAAARIEAADDWVSMRAVAVSSSDPEGDDAPEVTASPAEDAADWATEAYDAVDDLTAEEVELANAYTDAQHAEVLATLHDALLEEEDPVPRLAEALVSSEAEVAERLRALRAWILLTTEGP